ncbi:TPA: recombination protein NinG [Mannheimia haemolytica]|uniref:recombination protein NinG n=1 Tax=Mannheimia haemolytica TaxID=75985 RepID=UPI0002D93A73|nr:recombination protein NinG [Mannheimia haemolytica]MDW0618621.1 recombination protein NinG [Mannheimia haemolytica]MDW0723794.1 recombination protein NinG [Mannheimia haemolytica]MDW0737520.1 recombination protein NinG [Mannheimia haemolytica]QEB85379.1 protein NinG [Mannheimia haemolytica]QEB87803.1 protein NinG [Mannheimia haemolytica]
MANKPPKQHKCKECGGYYIKFQSTQQVCSVKCAMAMGKRKTETKRKQADKAERKERKQRLEKLKSRSAWLKDLQNIFNKFIRLRDKDLPCISCGRHHQGQWHAGHYKTVGGNPELRFNEDNVNRQCSVCNNHKSGNIVNYRINLIEKIGLERVEFLERKDHPPLKLTIEQIKDLIKVYKAKCKELERVT